MTFLRRFEVWLIIGAVVVALTLSCSGCTRAEPAAVVPQPSREIARFKIGDAWDGTTTVTEFRDSAGRVCVLAKYGEGIALSCARPLPPMDYEDLPPVEGEKR